MMYWHPKYDNITFRQSDATTDIRNNRKSVCDIMSFEVQRSLTLDFVPPSCVRHLNQFTVFRNNL